MKNIKTKIVKFSNGLVKDASLKVPTEACSANDVACLIRESYLEWRFGPENRSIMSDEVVVSSLGQAHFFEGALGGYESRYSADLFKVVKDCAENWIALACDVVRFRAAKQGRKLSQAEVYLEASKNEALSKSDREALAHFAKMPEVVAA